MWTVTFINYNKLICGAGVEGWVMWGIKRLCFSRPIFIFDFNPVHSDIPPQHHQNDLQPFQYHSHQYSLCTLKVEIKRKIVPIMKKNPNIETNIFPPALAGRLAVQGSNSIISPIRIAITEPGIRGYLFNFPPFY